MPEPIRLDWCAPITVAAAGDDDPDGRRLIVGQAVPWNVTARVRSGQLVRFEPGSLALAGTAVVRDHDLTRPIGRVAVDAADDAGLGVRIRVSETGPGDEALTLAADGVLGQLSVAAVPTDYRFERDDDDGEPVLVVSAADPLELSLLIRGAYGADAAVSRVAATSPPTDGSPAVPDPTPTPTAPAAPIDPVGPAGPAVVPVTAAAPVRVNAEPFPYTFAGVGPSILRDCVEASDGNYEAAARIARAQRMLADPGIVRAGAVRMADPARAALIEAIPGQTTGQMSELVHPGWRPDLYVETLAAEAPLWSVAQSLPIADFTPFTLPTAGTTANLSGSPLDEITPNEPGAIDPGLVTVTPQHVMGSYQFSRDLALSSNPAVDVIAAAAMNEAWLLDVETRAAAYVLGAGNNTDSAVGVYADGAAYVKAIRKAMAETRIQRHRGISLLVSGDAEYLLAADAEDTTERPLLPWTGAQQVNAPGSTADAIEAIGIYGRALVPQGAGIADGNTVAIVAGDLVAFATPVWNFRFENVPYVPASMIPHGMTNPLLLQLTKYSGVAFWTRQVLGVRVLRKSATAAAASRSK